MASDEFFGRHGAQHPLGAGFSGAQDLLPQDWDEPTAMSHLAQIPSSLLREYFLERNTRPSHRAGSTVAG
jgi:phthiodiolone/phenolphthiodiolone dimycocerosates ketoreductase